LVHQIYVCPDALFVPRAIHAGGCARARGAHSAGTRENHDQRQRDALSARPGEPELPGAAANALSDFTYVATCAGFVYVAFVIDAYLWEPSALVAHARICPGGADSTCVPTGMSRNALILLYQSL
jgi:hypothetical protein